MRSSTPPVACAPVARAMEKRITEMTEAPIQSGARPARWLTACVLLLLASGCARSLDSSGPRDSQGGAGPLPTTAELMQREADAVDSHLIGGAEAGFEARALARQVGDFVPLPGADRVRLDIGAEADVFCWFYHDSLNLAEGLVAQSDVGLDYIARRSGPLKSSEVERIDAGVSNGRVFLAIDRRYSREQAGGPREGLLKVIATSIDGNSILCTHDALGYRVTFRRFFSELIASVAFSDAALPRPYYRKVELIELAGQPVGVRRIDFRMDEAGDSEISIATSAVIPSGHDTLSSNDRYCRQYSTPDGAIINEFVAETIDGEEKMRLELAPRVTGGWNVRGTEGGHPLSVTLPGALLPSFLGQSLDLRRAIEDRGVGAQWKFETWIPNLDSSHLTQSRTRITEERADQRFAVITKFGPSSLGGVSDVRGSMRRSEMEIGAKRMVLRQVFEVGEF